MPLILFLSYAFSIWMVVDAFKRGAEHYWYLIIFCPFGEWIYFFLVKIHDFKNTNGVSIFGSKFKCSGCIHCDKLFGDGVRCINSGRPHFKTNVHIGYCTDFQPK